MTEVPPVGGLQIDQDLDYQRREWAAQRIGWGVMALVAAAALAGGFGRGPVAWGSAASADGSLRVTYERLVRKRAPSVLVLRLGPNVAVGDTVRVWFDQRLAETLNIERVVPEPVSAHAAPDGYIYGFTVADPAAPTTLLFDVEADRPGWHRGRIGLAGHEPLRIGQFVYP